MSGTGATDAHAVARLTVDACLGALGLVEGMHREVAHGPGLAPLPAATPARGLTRRIYAAVRTAVRGVGRALDATAPLLPPAPDDATPAGAVRRDALLAALGGVVGDHLAATGSPLAIPMRLRHEGRALPLADPAALARLVPAPSAHVVVIVHGLCLSHHGWRHAGRNAAAELARELGATPLHLHYNTGRPVSESGGELTDVLNLLTRHWPTTVARLTLITHSMGGLVARSAIRHATERAHGWPDRLRDLVFLGTPHHGAPLERIGGWIDGLLPRIPYAAALAPLGRMRSAGITDLRHGWIDHRAPSAPTPLPDGVRCHAIGATLGRQHHGIGDAHVGDGLVPLPSALGDHPDPARALGIPADRRWVARGIGHLALMRDPDVFARLRGWLDG